MKAKDRQRLYQRAVQAFGREFQLDLLVEEASELIKAVMKYKRKRDSEEALGDLAEELADVEIMIEQLYEQTPSLQARAALIYEEKLERTHNLLLSKGF